MSATMDYQSTMTLMNDWYRFVFEKLLTNIFLSQSNAGNKRTQDDGHGRRATEDGGIEDGSEDGAEEEGDAV